MPNRLRKNRCPRLIGTSDRQLLELVIEVPETPIESSRNVNGHSLGGNLGICSLFPQGDNLLLAVGIAIGRLVKKIYPLNVAHYPLNSHLPYTGLSSI